MNLPSWRRIVTVARGVLGFKAVWLCTVLGAAGAPVAYYSGIALGAGTGADVRFYVTVGLFYAAATPLLVELGRALEGGAAAPGGRKIPGAT